MIATRLLKHFGNYFLKFILLFVGVIALAIPLVLLHVYHPAQARSLTTIFAQHTIFFTFLRWLLIGVFFMAWPVVIRHISQKHAWELEKTSFWLSQRLRLTAWLIIFEIVVCENLLIALVKIL